MKETGLSRFILQIAYGNMSTKHKLQIIRKVLSNNDKKTKNSDGKIYQRQSAFKKR